MLNPRAGYRVANGNGIFHRRSRAIWTIRCLGFFLFLHQRGRGYFTREYITARTVSVDFFEFYRPGTTVWLRDQQR